MSALSYELQLLAPAGSDFHGTISVFSSPQYEKYLDALQKLRGLAYLRDGAIQPWQIDTQGRYRTAHDEHSWHFLLLDSNAEVAGCARYRLHSPDVSYSDLGLSRSPLSHDSYWGPRLREAVEAELRLASEQHLRYAELGGWAIAERYRNTRAALEVLLGSYAWAELIGGCICSCTATVRNLSALILRRIGGRSLRHGEEELPAYFDSDYGCWMELLRFDSREIPTRFQQIAAEVRQKLTLRPIIGSTAIWDENRATADLLALQTAVGKSLSSHARQFAPESAAYSRPLLDCNV
jgi:hypothetical protein